MDTAGTTDQIYTRLSVIWSVVPAVSVVPDYHKYCTNRRMGFQFNSRFTNLEIIMTQANVQHITL